MKIKELRQKNYFMIKSAIFAARVSCHVSSGKRFMSLSTLAPNYRQETDSFGPINVPADKYWGAQTQR